MSERDTEVWRNKDGRAFRIGGNAEVAWIENGITDGLAITSAIPLQFEDYATLELPGTPNGTGGWSCDDRDLEEQEVQDTSVVAVLSEHTAAQPWWLG